MQEHFDDVPSSVKYPKEEIIKALLPNLWRDIPSGKSQIEHFTSSAAYAIALALYMGAKQIELHGIEMTSDTEYVRQRDGVTFWLGVATGRGVNVVIHSPLFMNDKPYGYTGEVVIQRQAFEISARKLDQLVEEAKTKTFEAKGRSQAMLDAFLNVSNQADLNRLLPELLKTFDSVLSEAFVYGELAGRHQENTRYMKECDELIRAAGGEKSLQVLMGAEVQNVETV